MIIEADAPVDIAVCSTVYIALFPTVNRILTSSMVITQCRTSVTSGHVVYCGLRGDGTGGSDVTGFIFLQIKCINL